MSIVVSDVVVVEVVGVKYSLLYVVRCVVSGVLWDIKSDILFSMGTVCSFYKILSYDGGPVVLMTGFDRQPYLNGGAIEDLLNHSAGALRPVNGRIAEA